MDSTNRKFFKFGHCAMASTGSGSIDFGITIEERLVHPLKAPNPIMVTFSGMLIVSRLRQSRKAKEPIAVIDFGK